LLNISKSISLNNANRSSIKIGVSYDFMPYPQNTVIGMEGLKENI
jgi:hypothetical protein